MWEQSGNTPSRSHVLGVPLRELDERRYTFGGVITQYGHCLTDTAIGGRPVTILLWVRRFICDGRACGISTFVEQVPGLTSPYARRTPLLRQMLTSIGVALAGRA